VSDIQVIHGPEAVNGAIDSLVDYVVSLGKPQDSCLLVGISNGGVPLVREMARRLTLVTGETLPVGVLNVSFHRDDIGSRPITAPKEPTQLPLEVQHRPVILVDDVIHSGRTVRAALDELFEHGRPSWVKLLVLVDRGERVLPIQPDYAGFSLDLETARKLQVVIDAEDPMQNHVWMR
jgi:pyrimidine operon attenuation protein / uracil phosphoribosyltransferase